MVVTEKVPSGLIVGSNLFSFTYGETTIRSLWKDNEPWFVAVDVCQVLEITNPSKALLRLDEDEKMTLTLSEGHSGQRGGAQMINVVNEPGLYTLILGSRKPEAKDFRRWITHEVLPSIRKTGYYSLVPDKELIELLRDRVRKNPQFFAEINKNEIKRDIKTEKRMAAFPLLQEAWQKYFVEEPKEYRQFFAKLEEIRKTSGIDSAFWHRYYDYYLKMENKVRKGDLILTPLPDFFNLGIESIDPTRNLTKV